LKIQVEINSCRDCRYIDHSGSFTVRGRRDICGHYDACVARHPKINFKREYPEYADRDLRYWKYHWYNRTVGAKTIPDWCPLKHGATY